MRAHLKSNAVLLNFHVAQCLLVCLGTAEQSRNTCADVGQSSWPFPEHGDLSPVDGQYQGRRGSECYGKIKILQ